MSRSLKILGQPPGPQKKILKRGRKVTKHGSGRTTSVTNEPGSCQVHSSCTPVRPPSGT